MITTALLASALGWLLQATVKGSLLVLLVIAINALIGTRLDARWRHLLWIIVIVRLLLPSGPSSPLSLFNLLPSSQRIVHASAAAEAPRVLIERGRAADPVQVRVEPSPWIAAARWAAAVWALGFAVLAMRALLATIRTRRAVATALRSSVRDERLERLLADCRRQLAITRPLQIAECRSIRTPALHGVFHPVLLLPPGLAGSFSDEELRYVILHELWHQRRMDVAVSWALSAVQAVHWFNPLVWLAASRIKEERELACDELALSCLEEDERLGYGTTILKLLASFQTAAPVPALVGIVNGKQKMKRRLTMIASFRTRTRFSMFLLVLVAALGVAALTDATAGERVLLRHGDPAALPTMEKMHKPLSLEVANATLGDLLNTIAAKTGVAVTQSPEIASLPIQQARFTIKAENVPAQAVLMEALMPFELMAQPTAEGVKVVKGDDMVLVSHDGRHMTHESVTETAENGQTRVEKHVVVLGGPEADAHAMAHESREVPPGATEQRVMIKASVMGGPAKFDESGKLHREVKLTMNENGVDTEGKLTVDIQK